MRKLTARGIKLRKIFEGNGLKVIEVYPGGAQDVLGIPRKQQGLEKLGNGLKKLKIKGVHNTMSGDELDAVTCAYVGKLHLEGKAVTYGTVEQAIIMPISQRGNDCSTFSTIKQFGRADIHISRRRPRLPNSTA
jgi:predicted nuclease with RNAse H fold